MVKLKELIKERKEKGELKIRENIKFIRLIIILLILGFIFSIILFRYFSPNSAI